jgi:membrane protein required for colicin V production
VNWVDWILVGIVAASVLAGLLRGAVRTVLSLAGLAVGFFVASRESGALALVLGRWMSPAFAAALGFVLVFLGIGLAFALAAWLLRKALEALALTWLDRAAGGAVGLLRGVVIVGVLALALEGVGGLPAAYASRTYPWALRTGWALLRLVPDEARARLHWEALDGRIPVRLREMRDDREVV